VILMLAPETNGEVAVKAWEALSKATGREHAHLALPKEDEKIRFRDRRAAAQDHLLADLVGDREREGLLQRRLHQRARADPVAHADRPPAALSGSPVDAGLRRGLCVYRPPVDLKTSSR
jgi:nitrate reductase alpha subunit